jgi:hypothetical protein
MSRARSPLDPDVEFAIHRSETSVDDDGYERGEPKHLVCLACGESVPLTEVPSAGVFRFPHTKHCPQRFTTDGARQQP